MQLNLSNVEYTYPSAAEPALRGITATFQQGWTGIVGDNGGGKTTLALVASGIIRPDSGSVGPDLVSHYCAQDATAPPENLADFSYAYDKLASNLRSDLGIDDEWPWRYHTLSGGQQKRLQVACALWAEPDLLVMDEPTNHVDATTREVIARALLRFSGIGLLISHDRALLDELCERCLFVSNGKATMRPGGYTAASAQAGIERDTAMRSREQARKERDRVAAEAQRRREEASRADSKRSARGVGKHDGDARHRLRLAIVTGKDGVAGKLSSRMDAKLARAEEQLSSSFVEKRYEADIWIGSAPSRRPVLVRMEEGEIALGDQAILRTPALYIGNREHIGLAGDNGSGKTTLVKALLAHIPEHVRVLYIPQEPTADQRDIATTRLSEIGDAQRGRVLSIVAQLNSEPERVLEGVAMSPGEMRKLMLALGILDSPELIIMDEPTNHLDLGSALALERVLEAFPGALLLVSHDATLLERTTSVTWSIARSGDTAFVLQVN